MIEAVSAGLSGLPINLFSTSSPQQGFLRKQLRKEILPAQLYESHPARDPCGILIISITAWKTFFLCREIQLWSFRRKMLHNFHFSAWIFLSWCIVWIFLMQYFLMFLKPPTDIFLWCSQTIIQRENWTGPTISILLLKNRIKCLV